MDKYFIGIDIGSTSAKTIVLDENKNIVDKILVPTGWSSKETSELILDKLNKNNYYNRNSIVVATGYGRVSVSFASKTITEITCHARGANELFANNNKSNDISNQKLLIIDIGGQDTKIIQTENGNVVDFLMNDKCSAGTGRFLEVMCNTLALNMDELCDMASKGSDTHISSLCTVFAESEVISLIGRGEKRENIAYAIVDSIIKKVCQQAQKLFTKDITVCLTGGLSSFKYISDSISKELKTKVLSTENGQFAGALGAAIMGM